MGARALNAVLGLWLFMSAFLWSHRPEQFHNAWVTGLVAVTMALWGLEGVRRARFVNMLAGAWLLVSSLLWLSGSATFWNHVLVGLALVVLGAAPSLSNFRRRGRVHV
jgi:hypothetical protein